MTRINYLTHIYSSAKSYLLATGFKAEIEWQNFCCPERVDESTFLRETAWVIYNSGFRESVVRKKFDFLSLCFCEWESAYEIVTNKNNCISSAMLTLANRRKHEAVVEVANLISVDGFEFLYSQVLENPLVTLQKLPFIGPITACHLAKNLGFDIAKPDRHMVKLYKYLGFTSVESMCAQLSAATGDPVRVVDLVLWRFLEQTSRLPKTTDSPLTPDSSSPLTTSYLHTLKISITRDASHATNSLN